VDGTLVLQDRDGWKVTAIAPPVNGEAVPSDGGDPAAQAPIGLFVGTLAVGLLLVVGCTFLIRAAGEPEPV